MRIRQHLPSFVSFEVERHEANIENPKDILELSWIKTWSEEEDFDFFSVSIDEKTQYSPKRAMLMASMKDGKFWVVAYLDDADADWSWLPSWKDK